jgi:radical SAM superfamily enzyme YgiQ (UPF0313 family)
VIAEVRPSLRFLLVRPWDPECGEYTFLAPPLGVWRLAGALQNAGTTAEVFDPNCVVGSPETRFEELLRDGHFDLVGFSTTGMTLRFDLTLAHLARRVLPRAFLVAGGMEATFRPQTLLELGPFDLVVLGEGERPLLELASRMKARSSLEGVPGTVRRLPDGTLSRRPQLALTRAELADAVFGTPYEKMPFRQYWRRLETAYQIGALPYKAQREAQLSEIRAIRLNTLNYCPLGCTFCSSTNFLNAAQDGTVRIARLNAEECVAMLRRIVSAYPDVRTIIFQDDIFAFTSDERLVPLCEGILAAKRAGELPAALQFISTNRIDAMTEARLALMRRAGFRVLGFGVESFSRSVLEEFHKGRIFPFIEPVLRTALALGITPFLDLILTSPRGGLADLAETIRSVYRWVLAGCEVGVYPYVIPFSGSAMAGDAALRAHTVYAARSIPGTSIRWEQPAKILPQDPAARDAILRIERAWLETLPLLSDRGTHLPSRVRSLLWTACAVPELARRGFEVPPFGGVVRSLKRWLPQLTRAREQSLVRTILDSQEDRLRA